MSVCVSVTNLSRFNQLASPTQTSRVNNIIICDCTRASICTNSVALVIVFEDSKTRTLVTLRWYLGCPRACVRKCLCYLRLT